MQLQRLRQCASFVCYLSSYHSFHSLSFCSRYCQECPPQLLGLQSLDRMILWLLLLSQLGIASPLCESLSQALEMLECLLLPSLPESRQRFPPSSVEL